MTFVAVMLCAAPVVHVDVASSCAGIDTAEVRRVAALELRSTAERETPFATTVTATCEGARVTLDVTDALSRKALQRSVDLAQVPPVARTRTLALAVVELVAASWSELALNPEPRVEPSGPAPPEAEREAARARAGTRPTVRLLLEGEGQALVGDGLRLWGAGLRVEVEPGAVLGVEVDLRVDHGAVQVPLGTVSADRAALGVSLAARTRFDAVGLKALAGVRGGAVRLSGEPEGNARGGSGGGPWVGLHLGGAATLDVGPVCAELGVEVGAPVVGVVATVDGVPAVSLNNLWIGARVAVGWRL